jgi:hypothetical protein
MKVSWVAGIVIIALLAASGVASIQPAPSPANRVGITLEDAHFQYYEEIRPLLIHDHAAPAVMCDRSAAARAATVR